jgi:vacuolar-type H+-ATPase subunit E/Vma4
VEFKVSEGDEERLEGHLRQSHPGLLPRSTINRSPDVRGGVEVTLGRQLLDNTLSSRLRKAWQQLEPEIAAMLFGWRSAAAQPPTGVSLATSGSLPLHTTTHGRL